MNSDRRMDSGTFICEATNHALPPLVMYGAALFATLLGVSILFVSSPLLFGHRQGDLTGGIAGTVVAVILMVAGVAARISARRYRNRFRIVFHTNGVFLGKGFDLRFVPFADLQTIVAEITSPSVFAKLLALVLAVISLLFCDLQGAGAALISLKPHGIVRLQQFGESPFVASGIAIKNLETIGKCATSARSHNCVLRLIA